MSKRLLGRGECLGIVTFFLASLIITAAFAEPPPSSGTIIVEGGGFSSNETLKRFADLVGTGKQLCFITTASPQNSSGGKWLRPFGLAPKPILVTAENSGSQEISDELVKCDAYYFDGGAPKLLSDAFLKNGRDTLALATIRKRYREGATIAGGSAGAMILGPATLCTCATAVSMKTLTGQAVEVSPGFNFVSVPIDAHVFVRNLYGRELAAMAQEKWARMLALDEGAAVEIPGDGSPWRILGNSTVAILHAPEHAPAPFTNYDISFLRQGDLIDPASLEAITTGRKPLSIQHGGLAENLQAPTSALYWMANDIAAGNADVFFWDSFWKPEAPIRIRLAWGEKSAAFEGAGAHDTTASLLTHLSLSVAHPVRDDFAAAVMVPLGARLDKDWGVLPIEGPRKDCVYHAVTPTTAPGVAVVDRDNIKKFSAEGHAVLINALPPDGAGQTSIIPGSIWLGGAGACGVAGDAVDKQLSLRLTLLTDGERSKPLVFYCANAMCWFSYNAAQRARHMGYTNVSWYRGGLQDWGMHGDELVTTAKNQW